MAYIIIKALHIIFMVSYFAGLFYLVRLFVYYKDTDSFPEPKKSVLREQYVFMLRRLWNIILAPAGVLMTIFGVMMLCLNPILLKTPWFHLKLIGLLGLAIYHYWSWKSVLKIKKLQGKNLEIPNVKLRQFNEIATFLLFFIIFTVVLKGSVLQYWWQLLLSFIGLIILITMVVKLVNRNKSKK